MSIEDAPLNEPGLLFIFVLCFTKKIECLKIIKNGNTQELLLYSNIYSWAMMTLIPRYILLLTLFCALTCPWSGFSQDFLSERLNHLRNKGFQPRVIYDIGAHGGMWTRQVQKIFCESQFYLFEANEIHKPSLQQIVFPSFIAVLGDSNREVIFYSNNSTGDSILREQTLHYADGRCVEKLVQMMTLESIVLENSLPLPDLVKIDVQGAETLIIQGSPEVICNAEVVILETKILEYNKDAPLVYETINLMHDLGYRILDITELHFLATGELCEIDILFVKESSSLIKRGIL